MKTPILLLFILVGFFSALTTHAAFNDVVLETSAILDVGGYELTIYSTRAYLISIGAW